MKILIIEDDELKYQHLKKYTETILPQETIYDWKKSYHSGLDQVMTESYNLILLDMSMHIYEKTAQESGGSFETYAGRMILSEIDMYEVETKVIVITGYDVYNDGKTLETLKTELRQEFGDFYIDTIYFIGSDDRWKTNLLNLINVHILNNNNESE
jgi:DNA-binding NarL/FixJ family response regulator